MAGLFFSFDGRSTGVPGCGIRFFGVFGTGVAGKVIVLLPPEVLSLPEELDKKGSPPDKPAVFPVIPLINVVAPNPSPKANTQMPDAINNVDPVFIFYSFIIIPNETHKACLLNDTQSANGRKTISRL